MSCLVIINCIEFQTGHYPYLQTNADTSQLFDCTIVCQEILKFSQTNIIYLKQCALSTIEPVKESFITVFLWNTSSLSQHILYLWNLTAVLAKISNVSSVWFFFLLVRWLFEYSGLGLWCLVPLSTIFKLHLGGQFYWSRKTE